MMIRLLWTILITSYVTVAWAYIPTEFDHKIQATKASIEKNEQSINTLSLNIKQRRKKAKIYQQALENIDKDINIVSKGLYELQFKIKEQQVLLDNLLSKKSIIKEESSFSGEKLSKLVQVAASLSKENKLKLMLNQSDPWLMDRLAYQHGQIQTSILQHLDNLKEQLSEISDLTETYEENQKKLSQKKLEQKNKLSQLSELKKQQTQEKSHLVSILSQDEQALSVAQKDQTSLTKKLNGLKAQKLKQESLFSHAKGQIQWPLKNIDTKRIQKKWRRTGSIDKYIIDSREGEPVFSVFSGKIIFSDWLRGFGLITIIDHGSGYMSLYGHNQTLLKQTGEWVEAGEIIALVGQSGGVGKGGLYFEIRKDGQPQNLAKWYQ